MSPNRVITYDRRGFGKSSQPTTGYNYDTFAEDLHKLLTHLELDDVALVGFNTDLLLGKRVIEQAIQSSWNVAAGASAKASLACVPTWHEDFHRDLARIELPALVIHGDADRIVPITASGLKSAKLIKGARLVVVKNWWSFLGNDEALKHPRLSDSLVTAIGDSMSSGSNPACTPVTNSETYSASLAFWAASPSRS